MSALSQAVKTTLLLSVIAVIFMCTGYLLGGSSGMMFAFLFSLIFNLAMFWFSSSIVLKIHKAKEVDEKKYPNISQMTRQLSLKASIPTPKLYTYDSPSPNAFATGRSPKNAVVALSTGLISLLDEQEVEGVIAHEIAHIKNNDMLIATIAASIGSAISQLVHIAAFSGGGSDDAPNPLVTIASFVLAPIAAMLVQMSISRTRELGADATAAKLVGYPDGLISALKKLEISFNRKPALAKASHSSAAHLYIANPFRGSKLQEIFSTHPPTAKRIKALQRIAI